MHNLKYKTRGNSDYKGKPKVFFTTHPDDFELYFDTITDEILGFQNCSIWYFEDQDGMLDDDDEFNLAAMNLFVVPVSSRYLTSGSLSADSVIPYALKHNISVLPFIEEPGIDELFQKKFQNMQYLIDDPTDTTAISYREKLGKRLDAIFWGEELAEQIRSAFDAYIFMSYRKKDRMYAQKLMQLIHQNRFCWDIAIWYDEYLTPGEDFNQSIKNALEKSSLFTLVVTPNLVNEDNYVKNIEYPMALEKNKPILPVEMLPTDAEEMASSYSGISDIMSVEEAGKIYERIGKLIPGILDGRRENDPVHNFFMGLAYLQGTEVEVNRERGVLLITESAESGLDDAVDKLVNIYFYGDGVPVDYDKALGWQRKIVNKYGAIAENSMKEVDIIVYLRHLYKLADMEYKAEKFDSAYGSYEQLYNGGKLVTFGAVGKGMFGKIGNLLKKYSGHSEYYEESLYFMIDASRMLLMISNDLGVNEIIEKWTKNAMLLVQAANYASDDIRVINSYRLTAGALGEMCLESGNIQGADIWFEKEAEYIEYSSDSELQERISRANSYNHKEQVRVAMKDLDEAIFLDKKAFTEWKGLYLEYKDVNYLKNMVSSLLAGARVYALKNDRANKLNVLKIAKDFVEESDYRETVSLVKLMAHHDILVADTYMTEKKYDEAFSLYKKALTVLTKDADLSVKAVNLRDAAYSCQKIGDYYFKTGKYADAWECYSKGQEYITNVMLYAKTVGDGRRYTDSLERLFDAGLKTDRYEESAEWIDKACTTADYIAQSTNLDSDIGNRNRLFAKREEYRRNKNQESKRSSGQVGDGCKQTLMDYWMANKEDISNKTINEVELFIERGIGGVCRSFAEQHPLFKGTNMVDELGRILTRNAAYVANMTDKRIAERHYLLSEKIADVILEYLDSMKYDEQAMGILSYCGFYNLKESRHVIGGKNKALEDYYSFYRRRVFWKYHLSEVEYPDIWCYMTVWINTLVDENGVAYK